MSFERSVVSEVLQALAGPKPLIQAIVGPRQVGKTTAALHLEKSLGWPSQVASADAPVPHPPEWIESQWRVARARADAPNSRVLLVLDEIQKVPGWSEVLKRLWDLELRQSGPVRPLILGSSALLVQRGLTESLAGRFFLHRCPHWDWTECRQAFGWRLDQWLYFGGYPGAAALAQDESVWRRYVNDSLIEAVLARDVLQMHNVAKPALLRHLFGLAGRFPAQILSYNKMLGQLHDAGNTTTLAHYLHLLGTAYLASGLEQFSAGQVRRRGSSPKLVLWNNALASAPGTLSFSEAFADGPWWGRLVENAVGARLLQELVGPEWSVTYWRDGDAEVDYVVQCGSRIWAIEVKSGRPRATNGLEAFRRRYPTAEPWIIGGDGLSLEDYFDRPATAWFR